MLRRLARDRTFRRLFHETVLRCILLSYPSLLDRDLFSGLPELFLLGKQELQDAIFIFGLDSIGLDPVIQVKAAFKGLERKFFTDGLVVFAPGFLFLFENDDQLTIINRELEIFLDATRSCKLEMVSISRFVDIYRRKAKAVVAVDTGRKTLEKFIYKIGQALVCVIVYFYECHIRSFLSY